MLYVGPYYYFSSIFSRKAIVLTVGTYIGCTIIGIYWWLYGVGYFTAVTLAIVQIVGIVWLVIQLLPELVSDFRGKFSLLFFANKSSSYSKNKAKFEY